MKEALDGNDDVFQVPEIAGTVEFEDEGYFRIVVTYYRGFHPHLGAKHNGHTGIETVRTDKIFSDGHSQCVCWGVIDK